jgi:hypothetical protein
MDTRKAAFFPEPMAASPGHCSLCPHAGTNGNSVPGEDGEHTWALPARPLLTQRYGLFLFSNRNRIR